MNEKQGWLWLAVFALFAIRPIVLYGQLCEDESCRCHQNPAPAGVMISHLHEKGQWMLSYRFMQNTMEGLREGTRAVNENSVFSKYLMTDKQMAMNMHMFMAMVGITDRVTVMGMVNVNRMNMSMGMLPGTEGSHSGHIHSVSSAMKMTSMGIGDIRLTALYGLISRDRHQLIAGIGLNVPTGSVCKRDAANGMYLGGYLPYSMQSGSGTWDLLPGLTYTWKNDFWTASTQIQGTFRPGANVQGYRLGHELNLNGWLARNWTPSFSTSVRLEGIQSGKIAGHITGLDASMEPAADASSYGGRLLNGFIGLQYAFGPGFLRNQKLGAEYGLPFYQKTNGIQMQSKQGLFASWAFQF
jgi:hypothetical protein